MSEQFLSSCTWEQTLSIFTQVLGSSISPSSRLCPCWYLSSCTRSSKPGGCFNRKLTIKRTSAQDPSAWDPQRKCNLSDRKLGKWKELWKTFDEPEVFGGTSISIIVHFQGWHTLARWWLHLWLSSSSTVSTFGDRSVRIYPICGLLRSPWVYPDMGF